MNVKEKIKIFWKNFAENWLWVTLGVYIGTLLMGWIEYFRGFLPLIGVLLPTFLIPLFLFGVYYVRKLDSRTINRLIWTIGGASVLGFPIWVYFYTFNLRLKNHKKIKVFETASKSKVLNYTNELKDF